MFERFEGAFNGSETELSSANNADKQAGEPLDILARIFGGRSFGGGVYRVIERGKRDDWGKQIALAFPRHGKNVCCFGYDWLGRVFGVRVTRDGHELGPIYMFVPGTGKVLEIPRSVVAFHDEELLEFSDEALAGEFYADWIRSGGVQPEYHQCIGYKIPLFLGGKDDITNLELSDIDVYWWITGQLIARLEQ